MTPVHSQAAAGAARWSGVKRVLAVRLDNLGDVLMTTPALAAMRESLPAARLTLLASPGSAAVAPHLDMVDEVWSFAAPWMQQLRLDAHDGVASAPGASEAAMVERLAEAGFDAAVIFTVCTQSALPAALLCRMAGIPRRLAHSRENPYALLTDWVAETDQVVPGSAHEAQPRLVRHEVQRQLALVASVGCCTADDRLRFAVHDGDRRRVAQQLQGAGLKPQRPYAVFHPGASAASRRWPAQHFAAAAAELARQGLAVVFSGDDNERSLAVSALQAVEALAPAPGAAPAASLAGRLSLGELAALIDGASVLITNNSAPAHLAAALGTPVVDLYALTNPQHTPWRAFARVLFHDVPCRWCLKSVCPQLHHDCLRKVEPQAVADAAWQLMREAAPALERARA